MIKKTTYKNKIYIYNIPNVIKRDKKHGICKGSHISIELKRLLEDKSFDITNPYDEESVFAFFTRFQADKVDNVIGEHDGVYPTLKLLNY